MQVLAISGSLRSSSYNTALLREAAGLAPEGTSVEIYDGLDRLPPYNDDLDGEQPPAEVARLRTALTAADVLLLATPEYNATIPGQLKNALDWASRPRETAALRGMSVAVMGASTGQYGAMWAQADLRKSLGAAGARVLDAGLVVAKAHERFDADTQLTDAGLRRQLTGVIEALAEAAAEDAASGARSGTAA